jgi:hypothetical protein
MFSNRNYIFWRLLRYDLPYNITTFKKHFCQEKEITEIDFYCEFGSNIFPRMKVEVSDSRRGVLMDRLSLHAITPPEEWFRSTHYNDFVELLIG